MAISLWQHIGTYFIPFEDFIVFHSREGRTGWELRFFNKTLLCRRGTRVSTRRVGVEEHVLSAHRLQARGSERCLLCNPHPTRHLTTTPSCPQSIGSEPGAPGWAGCNDLPQATEHEMEELGPQAFPCALLPQAGLPQPPPEGRPWALAVQDPPPPCVGRSSLGLRNGA